MLDLAFRPDRRGDSPLYRQLAEYLRGLVATSRLVPGEKLPATRELAAALALGRNTVTQAYEILGDEGVLTSHVGQGTFVASRLAAGPVAAETAPARGFVWHGLLSQEARRLAIPDAIPEAVRLGAAAVSGAAASAPPPRFDFRGGRVDLNALPQRELRRAYARAIGRQLPELANRLDPFGWWPLRREIARSLVSRGIRCDADSVVVMSGAQQALDFATRMLVDPGDTVVMEQPGYFCAALSFRAAGANVVGVGVDRDGLRTDELARVLRARRAKLIYTTPAAQFPTGVVLSNARRRALLELADQHQTPILEDDYDSEFRYDNPALPALKTEDPAGQVVYVGTFSKAIFPGLRLGYVVAERALLARIAIARVRADFGSDALAQAAVTELLTSGALERHVRRLRKRNAERRDAMLNALADSMPPGVEWTPPSGGHAVWLTLPARIEPRLLHAAAAESGIAYLRGDAYTLDESSAQSIALAFANHDADTLRAGIEQLAQLVKAQLALRASA